MKEHLGGFGPMFRNTETVHQNNAHIPTPAELHWALLGEDEQRANPKAREAAQKAREVRRAGAGFTFG